MRWLGIRRELGNGETVPSFRVAGGRWRENFQVSGLGNREPGSGAQVRVQVQGLNFVPHPYLYLITRTWDLRAETWDLRMVCGSVHSLKGKPETGDWLGVLGRAGFSEPAVGH
jgi:hypothetical protein